MQDKHFSCVKYSDSSIVVGGDQAVYSLIWLPDYGDSSDTYKQLFLLSESPAHTYFRIRILNPPRRPITILKNEVKNAWFDVKSKHQDIGEIPDE